MRKRPLVMIACVFLAGLVYQRYSFKLSVAVVALLIFRECWCGRKAKNFIKIAGRSIFLLSAFLLGIFHMQQEVSFRDAYMSKIEDGSRIAVWGELIKIEPTAYGNRGILSDCYIDFGAGVVPCNDIMVYTSKDQFQIGQIHKITGKVNMFSRARNEGNFDALLYYQSLKIDFAVDAEASVLLEEKTNIWKVFLLRLNKNISAVYDASLPTKTAGFYQAMVLGNKTELNEELSALFLIGGISHILAISGLHVSILGRGCYRMLRHGGVNFGAAGICGGIVLFSYCVMVGGSISTIRAVAMLLLYFLAQWLGRSYDMLNGLGCVVLFLLWENPFLIENSGFWFSITALLGVGFVGKELSGGVKRGKGFWMSLGITLTTLPITACSYYEIPIYSPVANFIVLPLLAPTFCLAVVGGLLGLWIPELAAVLLQPCHWLLQLYEWVCSMVAKLPLSCVICGRLMWWQIILYYIVLLGGAYLLNAFLKQKSDENAKKTVPSWKKQIFSKRSILTGIMLLGCGLCIFFPKAQPFEISFLDVGQGDGIYVSAGDGSRYFIDGGSSNVNQVGTYRILPFLKSKAVRSIDYWFVSHCDTDHISGLMEVLQSGYEVRHLVLAKYSPKDEMYKALLAVAKKEGVEVLHMEVGDRICSENIDFLCIAPSLEQEMSGNRNDNSLVLQMVWRDKKKIDDFSVLLAGDISADIEEILCKNGLLEDVDLLKAIHHGSNNSNGALLLETVQAEYIVVSCSENNLYGHPGTKTIERMETTEAEIFYTMYNGQVTFPLLQ